ncbi:hypothetical protein PP713_17940 [Mycobacterium sp. CSUR Q5927]|nr:hypothetical protein [Mycobacterium sp. CSUR Q5927]
MSTKVKVCAPNQVVHDGVIYAPGESAVVPDDVAKQWLAQGWVTEAKEQPRGRRRK